MAVRLAHEKGLLHQADLNHFQHWALLYWIYLDRRTQLQDRQDELEMQAFHLFPERWQQMYDGQPYSTIAPPKAQEEDLPVTDLDAIHAWYEQIEQQRTMSGADVIQQPTDFIAEHDEWPDDDQFGPWQ